MSRPLTAEAGNPARGAIIAADPNRGNCAICHEIPTASASAISHGDLGPSLRGVGSRLTVPQLRQRIVDPKVVSGQTAMPAYFRIRGLKRVQSAYAGKPILPAQDIEDLVAYLATLK